MWLLLRLMRGVRNQRDELVDMLWLWRLDGQQCLAHE